MSKDCRLTETRGKKKKEKGMCLIACKCICVATESGTCEGGGTVLGGRVGGQRKPTYQGPPCSADILRLAFFLFLIDNEKH